VAWRRGSPDRALFSFELLRYFPIGALTQSASMRVDRITTAPQVLLGNELSFPIADALTAARVPFLFLTASGFPAAINVLADAIRAADGVIFCTPEYNFSLPGGLKNAIDWGSRLPNQPFAGGHPIRLPRSAWRRPRPV
jgi:NAD(P)H-dependent FMN reductase